MWNSSSSVLLDSSRVRCRDEETRNEKKTYISTRNHVLFGFLVNTIALYSQEKTPLLMNENKRIDNTGIKIVKCVGAKAQDERMR